MFAPAAISSRANATATNEPERTPALRLATYDGMCAPRMSAGNRCFGELTFSSRKPFTCDAVEQGGMGLCGRALVALEQQTQELLKRMLDHYK